MDERAVVTVFLRNGGEVLLLRRSEEVGSYPGKWGGVAGHAEGDPDRAAQQEIREETGLEPDAVNLVRRGEQFELADEDLDTRWTIHPFLFEADTRTIETNWETIAHEWVHPTAILERETVPELWTSYDRVRPTVSTVTEDQTHGSAYLSIRALEVLRDEAAVTAETGENWPSIASVGAELRNARSEMAAVRNRIDAVMASASVEQRPEAVREAAVEGIQSAIEADVTTAKRAAERLTNTEVFTLSRSGTVRSAIAEADPDTVRIAISRPGGEGAEVAEEIAREGDTEVVLTSDANIPEAVSRSDVVLVGADTIARDGDVINKVGTRAASLAAQAHDVEAYAIAATAKISHVDPQIDDEADPQELYEGEADLAVRNPVFERTAGELVDSVITERGPLDKADIEAIAEQHADNAAWIDE